MRKRFYNRDSLLKIQEIIRVMVNSLRTLKWTDKLLYILMLLLGLGYLYLVILANLDLIDGRHVMFMDEWVTFDGLAQIFHARSPKELFWALVHGWDHRYGRLHWNVTALFAAWPYFQWGDQGLIFAQRMVPALLQFTAFLVLVFTYLKTSFYRLLVFALLLVLPNTSYYAHMPKPEPLQLLLLVLFFREILIKKDAGWRAFFLIGMAFGTKFSTLPFLIFSWGALSLLQKNKLAILKNIAVSCLGIICAVPILAMGAFKTYARWIRIGVNHFHDVEGTNFFTWWNFTFNDSIRLQALFVLLFLFILFLNFRDFKKRISFKEILLEPKFQFFVCSMSFLLPIMLNVKRLWFMYFHLGTIFLVMWMSLTYEAWLSERFKKLKILPMLLGGCLLGLILFKYGPIAFEHMRYIAHRTQSQEYREKMEEFQSITEYLTQTAREENAKLKVYYNPSLYVPPSTKDYRIITAWEPIIRWQDYPDVIVGYKKQRPAIALKEMEPKQLEYQDLAESLRLEKKYTTECQEKTCYKELDFIPERILIFKKIKL